MTEIDALGHELARLIQGYPADYLEARLEESQASYITYRGREPESIGKSAATGGNVRAMVKGGWGFTSFNSFDS
ncbi:MAG: DNA gyrase modulator, partial [Chloroflexota bacterium]